VAYREQMVTTPDGRDLQVATVGDPAGRTVFFHHGTPGSACKIDYVEALAADGDLFVVTMSRAGYSTSSRREGRNAASVVADVDAVLDALGRGDYLAVGWSGGGPHALACAALGAPRCRAAFCLAGVAPIDVDFNWTEGMGPENAEEFDLALRGGQEFEDYVAFTTAVMAEMTADNAIEMMGGLLSEVDAAALAPRRAREIFAATSREAFAVGYYGMLDDDLVFYSPWGFDVADITVPVEVWYGPHDLMVPKTHGDWLAANVAGATRRFFPDDGHVSLLLGHLDDLAASLRAVGA
jgi:pimeloyl-ACP methyl ester carboxylesterase